MIIVFDLDGVLISLDKRAPFKDTEQVLMHCINKQYHIALASANSDAKLFLRQFGWTLLFDVAYGNPMMLKSQLLQSIQGLFRSQRLVFFDDQPGNIEETRKRGFESYLVDPRVGVTMEMLRKLKI